MARKNFFGVVVGVLLKKLSSAKVYQSENEGAIYNNNNTKLHTQIGGADREIVTNDQSQTLTNKTIDADVNTISNIDTTEIKTSILDTATTNLQNDETHLATSACITKAIADAIATKDQAIEISYDNTTSGLVAINVQTALDEIDNNVDTQTTNLSNHISDTTTHGTTTAIVGIDDTQELKNKTIDSDLNDIKNIIVSDLKTSIVDTFASGLSNLDTNLATSKCITKAIADAVATKDQASEISYDNTTSGLTATNVQTAIDEVEGRLDTAETNIGTNATNIANHIASTTAHAASSITVVDNFGNSNATKVQTALEDLDSAITTNATNIGTVSSNLATHVGQSTAHGTTSTIVGISDSQILTNKTMDANSNTFSNFQHGSEVDNPSSNVHGVGLGSSVVGTTTTQNLSNKTLINPIISGTEIFEYAKQKTFIENINNNQVNTNIPGLAFNSNVHCVEMIAYVQIDSDTDYYTKYNINLVNENNTWYISYSFVGENSGISFDVIANGQVNYSTPNFTNFVSGFIKCFITSIELT